MRTLQVSFLGSSSAAAEQRKSGVFFAETGITHRWDRASVPVLKGIFILDTIQKKTYQTSISSFKNVFSIFLGPWNDTKH